jgi:hypothetical protein
MHHEHATWRQGPDVKKGRKSQNLMRVIVFVPFDDEN